MTHDESWERDLERAGAGVRPIGSVVGPVVAQVRRRRARRRGAVAVAAVVVAVGAVATVPVALGGGGSVPNGPAAPSSAERGLFDCPTGLEPWGERNAPPIEDLAEQQAIADRLSRTRPISAWRVMHVAPTALGPVALVDGRADLAQETLTREAGREVLVGRWSRSQPEDGYGLHAQTREAVEARLRPAIEEIGDVLGGLEGDGGLVSWAAAGAVVVQWKAPVPEAVTALAGVRADGVEVIVQPTRYSIAEIAEAQNAVGEWLDRPAAPRANGSTGCADGSGLVVGVVPPVEDPTALARELTEVAGMPVLVEEEPPLELEGG